MTPYIHLFNSPNLGQWFTLCPPLSCRTKKNCWFSIFFFFSYYNEVKTSKALVELETSLVSCFPAFRVKLKNWLFFTPKSVDFQICLWTWTWITSPSFLESWICLLQILGLLSLHYYMSPPHHHPSPPYKYIHTSVQFSSVTQSCLTLCNPWTAAW